MKKYRVYGTTTVGVVKEVWANNEDEAYERAFYELDSLTAYCGNFGIDKLVGVEGEDERVAADDVITYDDCEIIEEDPNRVECPDCREECSCGIDDNGDKYWYCDVCHGIYDENGEEFEPYFAEEDEEE